MSRSATVNHSPQPFIGNSQASNISNTIVQIIDHTARFDALKAW
jgi:hypothetical protein